MLNALVDSRVSAVSSKIHTTRENTLGFMTNEEHATQVEFIDAPGALGPVVPSLGREMWDAVRASHLALVIVDASTILERPQQVSGFLRKLKVELDSGEEASGRRTKTALVLNKVDKVRMKVRDAIPTSFLPVLRDRT